MNICRVNNMAVMHFLMLFIHWYYLYLLHFILIDLIYKNLMKSFIEE